MRFIFVVVIIAIPFEVSAQLWGSDSLNWPAAAGYPDVATMGLAPNDQAPAALLETARLAGVIDAIEFPSFGDNECSLQALRSWRRALGRAIARAHDHLIQVRDASFAVLALGEVRSAITAARELGKVYELVGNNYRDVDVGVCLPPPEDLPIYGTFGFSIDEQWRDRAADAYRYCDLLAVRFFVREPLCEAGLRRLRFDFDGTPAELVSPGLWGS